MFTRVFRQKLCKTLSRNRRVLMPMCWTGCGGGRSDAVTAAGDYAASSFVHWTCALRMRRRFHLQPCLWSSRFCLGRSAELGRCYEIKWPPFNFWPPGRSISKYSDPRSFCFEIEWLPEIEWPLHHASIQKQTSQWKFKKWINIDFKINISCLNTIHGVNWRHRIYGHNTFAILWVELGIMCGVNGWRFTVLFK